MPELPVGTAVQVRSWTPPGHVRTPAYLRGKRGVVARVLGPFPCAEDLAYGRPGIPRPLLRVRFRMDDVWGAEAERPDDTLEVEIFGHWLQRVANDAT